MRISSRRRHAGRAARRQSEARRRLREAQELAERQGQRNQRPFDDWTDEAEKRAWFLFEATRSA